MKIECFLATAGLMACAFAGPVEVGGLPKWELVDTEVSTNVPVSVLPANVRHLLVSLEFAGTPSNNVQVSFGRDANTNGTLEVEESGLILGWDCGHWVMRGSAADISCMAAGGVWTAEAATTDAVKRLDFDLGVRKAKPKEVVSRENGVSLAWNLPERIPSAFYDRSWNLLRLTVRGVDRADESLRAQLRLSGMTITIQ